MRVFFDQGTPVPLRHHLPGHQVSTAHELGWGRLNNGELLARAEAEGFDVLVTTDQNLKYQQNLANRQIAIVVLTSTSWPRIRQVLPHVVEAINGVVPNDYIEVKVPDDHSPPRGPSVPSPEP